MTSSTADVPQILLANLKDTEYTGRLQDAMDDVLHEFTSARLHSRIQQPLEFFCELIRELANAISDKRTIGEEYAEIIPLRQSDPPHWSSIGQKAELLMRVLRLFERRLVRAVVHITLLPDKRDSPDPTFLQCARSASMLRQWSRRRMDDLAHTISQYRPLLLGIRNIHRGLFYLTGENLYMSDKVVGVRYVSTARLQLPTVSLTSRVLGALIVCKTVISLLKNPDPLCRETTEYVYSTPESSYRRSEFIEKIRKCVLCLSARVDTVSAQCGHLYCWSCIMDWLSTRQECPLCHSPVDPSRLMYAINV